MTGAWTAVRGGPSSSATASVVAVQRGSNSLHAFVALQSAPPASRGGIAFCDDITHSVALCYEDESEAFGRMAACTQQRDYAVLEIRRGGSESETLACASHGTLPESLGKDLDARVRDTAIRAALALRASITSPEHPAFRMEIAAMENGYLPVSYRVLESDRQGVADPCLSYSASSQRCALCLSGSERSHALFAIPTPAGNIDFSSEFYARGGIVSACFTADNTVAFVTSAGVVGLAVLHESGAVSTVLFQSVVSAAQCARITTAPFCKARIVMVDEQGRLTIVQISTLVPRSSPFATRGVMDASAVAQWAARDSIASICGFRSHDAAILVTRDGYLVQVDIAPKENHIPSLHETVQTIASASARLQEYHHESSLLSRDIEAAVEGEALIRSQDNAPTFVKTTIEMAEESLGTVVFARLCFPDSVSLAAVQAEVVLSAATIGAPDVHVIESRAPLKSLRRDGNALKSPALRLRDLQPSAFPILGVRVRAIVSASAGQGETAVSSSAVLGERCFFGPAIWQCLPPPLVKRSPTVRPLAHCDALMATVDIGEKPWSAISEKLPWLPGRVGASCSIGRDTSGRSMTATVRQSDAPRQVEIVIDAREAWAICALYLALDTALRELGAAAVDAAPRADSAPDLDPREIFARVNDTLAECERMPTEQFVRESLELGVQWILSRLALRTYQL